MVRSVPDFFGETLLLVGAFAIGWVLHGVLIDGAFGPFSPAAILGLLGGGILLAVGRRLQRDFDPAEYVPGGRDDEDEELDEELLPIDEEMLEGREADESYRRK